MGALAYRGEVGPDGNPLLFSVLKSHDPANPYPSDLDFTCPLCGIPMPSPTNGLPWLMVLGRCVPQTSVRHCCDTCGDEYAPPPLMAHLRMRRADVARERATVADDGPSDKTVEAVAHSPRKPFEWPADRLE